MFNLQHIFYILVSGALTAALLILAFKRAHRPHQKNIILKISAVSTLIIHMSDLWLDYLTTGGEAYIGSTHIFPMYPCNIVMMMLLITSFIEKKEGLMFKLLAEFCFIIGTVCGVIGIVLNENFGNNPTLSDYHVLKGLLSHSTMLFGCIYLYVGGYVKPKISSTLSLFFGFGIFVICGAAVNLLFGAFGMESPDGIWIKGVPYLGVSSIILGLAAVLIYFSVFALLELRLPPKERWYSRAKMLLNKQKKRNYK